MMKNIKQLVLVLVAVLFLGLMLGVFISRLSNKNLSLATHNAGATDTQQGTYDYSDSLGKININHASIDELTMLPGIGKKTAERIVAYRQKFGPFLNIDDLAKVEGIGKKTSEELRPYITVGG